MKLLQKESELQEIVQLVGPDALPEDEKAIIFITKSIREDFLQQNAFHEVDSYCSFEKQYAMLKTILSFYEKILLAIKSGVKVNKITGLKVNERIARMKYEADFEKETAEIAKDIDKELNKLKTKDAIKEVAQ